MQKKFTLCLLLFFVLVITITIGMQNYHKDIKTVKPLPNPVHLNYWLKVVLLPLDSRPACTQFVQMLGSISGVQVIMPPAELMDNYKKTAQKTALREWLMIAVKDADAAIVSVDMLTHGGLLASRLSSGSPADSQAVVELLRNIHTDNAKLKIFAFNIIPRLLLADSTENAAYQKNVFKYSILRDQINIFENPHDIEELVNVESKIPPTLINRYNELYDQNVTVNIALSHLVEEGVLAGLVIGQDDGYPFGIPNISKKKIQNYIKHLKNNDKIFVTRGTDEVALTLLGKIITDYSGRHPRAYVMYSDEDAPRITMPYMPNTVATTVSEKLLLTGCEKTNDINSADFVLYINIGTHDNRYKLPKMAEQLKDILNQGHKVALVDLSENFSASQTLFPWLKRKNANVTKLIAYAGWNTTSNSIGTAVTQAVAFNDGLQRYQNTNDKIRLYQHNLEFLTARFLEDWYYLKDLQPIINAHLKDRQLDPYNLNGVYDQTNQLVNNMMQLRAKTLYHDCLANRAITIDTIEGPKYLYITDIKLSSKLPWSRTFEIMVEPKLSYGLDQKSLQNN